MATEDKIEIQVSIEGAAETKKELDGITASLEKQQRTQKMIAETSADIQRKNRIDAIKAEAKEVNNVSVAFRTLQASAAPANDVVQKATFQFGQFRAATAASAALVGNLGRSFTQIMPAAGSFVASIQSGGMAMSQFLGILGGGAGLAVGGVVAAVSLLATYFAKSADEAERLAEETKKNKEELKDYIDMINGQRAKITERIQAKKDEADYETKFGLGDLSSLQYAAERQKAKALYAEKGNIEKRLRAAYSQGSGDVELLSRMLAEAERAPRRGEEARVFEQVARQREQGQIENAAALKAIALDDEARQAEEARRAELDAERKKGLFPGQSQDKIQGDIAKIREQEKASRAREAALEAQQQQNELQFALDNAEKKYKAEKELRDKAFKDQKQRHKEELAMEAVHMKALQERNKAYTDAATNAAQIGATTTIKMFSDLAKGHEVAIGAVLEGIGDQMVAEGTRVLFQAAAMAFFPPTAPFAGGLAAVGAGEIAAGIALGAGGARAAGGSNAQPGGGGLHGGKNPFDTNYADPFGNTATYGEQSRGPTVININMPTVTSPTAEDGRRIQIATRKANNVYGAR
jgi:hypothetical protein